MAAVSSNPRQPPARHGGSPLHGLANLGSRRGIASGIYALGGFALLGAFWGAAIAVADWNALYVCVSLLGCVFILRDFRIGVVLLILLLPLSRSSSDVFPHEILGISGLNPFNLLLVGTLGSCLLHGLFDGSLRRFLPRPLLWLYIVPILIAGALGSRHVGDVAPYYYMYQLLDFDGAAGYLRELVLKPLLMVVYALLVGAAVSKAAQPEKFLVPALISIWVMSSMVIVRVYLSGVALSELASSLRGSLMIMWLGMHENQLGRLYAVAYALLLFAWAESKQFGLRLVLLGSMALVVAALTLTFSRGAFLGFIVVNVLFLLWRRSAKTLIFLGLLAAVASLLLPGAVYDRIESGSGSGLNMISSGRTEWIWLPLLPEILRSPIYGNGLGSILWSEAMHRADGVTTVVVGHPHNAYQEAVLDMGIAGLIIVCAYFAHVWKGFRALSVDTALSPALRGFYLGAAAGLASFLIGAITDSSLRPVSEQAYLWLAIGMMYGQRARKSAM
jgi:O-antigen ligase